MTCNKMGGTRAAVTTGVVACAMIALFLLPVIGDEKWLLGAVTAVLLAYCACLFEHERRRGHFVSPLTFYALLFAIHFALPGMLLAFGMLSFSNSANAPYATAGIILVTLCLVAFQGGVTYTRAARRSRGARALSAWDSRRVAALIVVLLTIGWAIRAYLIAQGAFFQISRTSIVPLGIELHSWIRMLEHAPMYAYVILLVAAFWSDGRPRPSRMMGRVLAILGSVEFAYWAIAGRKEEAILVLIYAAVTWILCVRRLPSLRRLAAGAALIVMLFPAAFLYRSAMQQLAYRGAPLASTVELSARGAGGYLTGTDQIFEIVLDRLNLLDSVSACVRIITTGEWKLRFGQDYGSVVVNMVPRVLWDEKPSFHYGTRFGHAAGVLGPRDWETSVSVTYAGEAFLNLGWFGWITFAAAGLLAELFYRSAATGRDQPAILFYLLILSPLLYVGGTAALYTGGLVKVLLLFSLLQVWLRRGPARAPLRLAWRSGTDTTADLSGAGA